MTGAVAATDAPSPSPFPPPSFICIPSGQAVMYPYLETPCCVPRRTHSFRTPSPGPALWLWPECRTGLGPCARGATLLCPTTIHRTAPRFSLARSPPARCTSSRTGPCHQLQQQPQKQQHRHQHQQTIAATCKPGRTSILRALLHWHFAI